MQPKMTSPATTSLLRRLAAWTAALAVLALVFASYLNPHRVVELGSQLWACF